jgi:hypothetical protein
VSYVALDLSLRSCGWAMWGRGQSLPAHGTWALGDLEHAGRAFVRLHANLLDLHKLDPIKALTFEEAIPAFALHGNSNAGTIFGAAGLAAHAMSFAEAIGCSYRAVNIAAWRRHFIGSMPRGTKTPDLKHMALKRCRELGIEVIKHDEAEAVGLLDYALSIAGIIPPWREAGGFFEREMRPATDGKAVRA